MTIEKLSKMIEVSSGIIIRTINDYRKIIKND